MRKILTRLILPETVEPKVIRKSSPLASNHPIYLAANYTCSEAIEGDYLEFGCFRGASFIRAYKMITSAVEDWSSFDRAKGAFTNESRAKEAYKKVRKMKRRFFAFDSFDGLPEVGGIDTGHSLFSKGRYDCTETEFREIISKAGVNLNDVVIVPGFYEDTLSSELKKTLNLDKAAIVMVDCDLYSSTLTVLQFITDLITDGTVIIFDDWFNFKANPNKGEQKACKEWLKMNPDIHLVPYVRWSMTQMSFIVVKNGDN